MSAWVIWLIIGLVLLAAEMMTLTFYLLWLGIAALCGSIVALLLPGVIIAQVIAAGAVALLLTYFSKPLTKRMNGARGYRDKGTDIVGKQGVVVEAIPANGGLGIVKIGSETWSAQAEAPIPAGETILVVSKSSTVVTVIKWEGV